MLREGIKKISGRLLPTDFYERFVAAAALRHQFARVLTTPKLPSREALWDSCIQRLAPETPIHYLEFGVWEGYSIKYFADRFTSPDSRFVGFDSFEGLPTRWGTRQKGTFSTDGAVPATDDQRIAFVAGWFQQTVEPWLADPQNWATPASHVLVHFDADLYSSTLYALAQLNRYYKQYHFLFDEFEGHECRALLNYQQAFGGRVEFIAHTAVQVFGAIGE